MARDFPRYVRLEVDAVKWGQTTYMILFGKFLGQRGTHKDTSFVGRS